MYDVCMSYLSDADIIVMAAAVADYTPEVKASQKIKKRKRYGFKAKKNERYFKNSRRIKKRNQILVGLLWKPIMKKKMR